jgi:hypothetical protein
VEAAFFVCSTISSKVHKSCSRMNSIICLSSDLPASAEEEEEEEGRI